MPTVRPQRTPTASAPRARVWPDTQRSQTTRLATMVNVDYTTLLPYRSEQN